MSIETLLISNRGEIACRIIRTARAMGIRTVAVYSDADTDALHVKLADDAVSIGPPPANESYLVGERIIEAAKLMNADAIHPGYGFLSENADFARAVEAAGVVFIGPPVKAIEIMGDKAEAKRAMIAAGVPCIPGYEAEDQAASKFAAAADDIGYPVMIKAAAGGGGRGMRLVEKKSHLKDALKLARSEAENAFGSGDLILEKAVQNARHVEIQVFADKRGHTIYLGERDCSVQRRHQKIIEEAPCPVMTPDLRQAMGQAAIQAAQTVDYVGAGTVEFLLDAEGAFYFLEMNTRLQVEHPVTEAITGLDLVELQLRVAAGEPLNLAQEDIKLSGHAIEVRLCAEDPEADFLPSTGQIHLWQPPTGAGVRVDCGIETGSEVTPHYDSMVAKIIVAGDTRDQARIRLINALANTALFGPTTNRDVLIEILEDTIFKAGEATTDYLSERASLTGERLEQDQDMIPAIAALISFLGQRRSIHSNTIAVDESLLGWTSGAPVPGIFDFMVQGEEVTAEVSDLGGTFRVCCGDSEFVLTPRSWSDGRASILAGEHAHTVTFLDHRDAVYVSTDKHTHKLLKISHLSTDEGSEGQDGNVRAPMHGALLEILARLGQSVVAGDRVAILEAMKMQHEILAPVDGTVDQLLAAPGDQVGAGDLLLTIASLEETPAT